MKRKRIELVGAVVIVLPGALLNLYFFSYFLLSGGSLFNIVPIVGSVYVIYRVVRLLPGWRSTFRRKEESKVV